jgi:ubiquinone/menaquinone biosynthesis C-methylase UbiE
MNTTEEVQNYWEANPLCAEAIDHEAGTVEFFEAHNRMRRAEEPLEFQRRIYEFDKWAGKSVLDVGCGTGYVVFTYASHGAKMTGVDIAEKSVELTKKRLALTGLSANIQWANAEQLPFENNTFDLVTSYGVLHHTPDTAKAIQEVLRVLKPGGKAIMMFYHKNSFAYRVLFPAKRMLQPKWRGKTPQQQVNAVDGPKNPLGKVFTRKELEQMMIGFSRFQFFTGLMFFNKQWIIPSAIRNFITSRWGWNLYVKAYKP